jgi:outer membrane protein TolC
MKRIFVLILIIFLLRINTASAETLVYKVVLEKAVKNSYDLKAAEIDVKIAQTQIKEARAEYLPIISANYNAQYDKDLTDGMSTLTSVGDSIVTNSTRYVNSLSGGIQYNLYDFGVRKKRLNIAKKDKTQKETIYTHNLRDLKLNLSQIYTKALLANRELKSNQELLDLNKALFSMYEKLYDSGAARKTDLANQALQVAVLINKTDDLRTELNKALKDLSYYTKENYTSADKILNLFDEEDGIVPISNSAPIKLDIKETEILNTENLPEYKEYQLEIEKKKEELSLLKRQNLPQFRFYTNYYLYGIDKESYFDTFSDFNDRSLTFRIASTLPVFDGGKNQAQRERAKLQIERLEIERDKKLEEVKNTYQKAYEEARYANEKLENQSKALILVEDKITMLEKLNNQQLIDKISYLKEKSDLITQKFDYERTRINSEEAAYKLRILAEASEPLPKLNKSQKVKSLRKTKQPGNP